MARDSIRDSIKKEDLIAYIEFELNADINHERSIVLVEGSDDIKLCKKIFEENVIFYESFSGKTGLHEIIEDDIIESRVIAVRDKDYVNIETLPERMFVYDTCCMEMMLLKNQEVLRGFCDVYCGDGQSCTDILHNAMQELSPYSVARRKNEEQDLGINFNKGFADLIRDGRLQIDELFLRVGMSEEFREMCKEEAAALDIEELYDITNGHDICKFLERIAVNGKKLGENGVRSILICSYRKGDFRETKLYDSIHQYQLQYDLQFVS